MPQDPLSPRRKANGHIGLDRPQKNESTWDAVKRMFPPAIASGAILAVMFPIVAPGASLWTGCAVGLLALVAQIAVRLAIREAYRGDGMS